MKSNAWLSRATLAGTLALISLIASCSAIKGTDLCNCLPFEPDIADYRHIAKHVPLPNTIPQEITVQTILSWRQTPVLPPDLPRFGRELTLVHVSNAFLQNATVNRADCDIHLEISAIPSRTAPRVIVETPVDGEYCDARRNIQSQLATHGFKLDANNGGDLPQAIPATVLGLPFEDFEHDRNAAPPVGTVWEIHPAIVTLTQ